MVSFFFGESAQGRIADNIKIHFSFYRAYPYIKSSIFLPETTERGYQVWVRFNIDAPAPFPVEKCGLADKKRLIGAEIEIRRAFHATHPNHVIYQQIFPALPIGSTPDKQCRGDSRLIRL